MRGIVDERVRGCFPKPAGGRQRGVHQAAKSLLRRLGGTRVRPQHCLRRDTLEGPRPQATSLLPSAHAPVRGLQGMEGYTALGIRGRAGAPFLALVLHLEDGAPPALRPRSRDPRRTLPHVIPLPLPTDDSSWQMNEAESRTTYEGPFGSVSVDEDPVRFVFRDASGRLLISTHNLADAKGVVNSMPTPLSFVRNASNLHRNFAASFTLSPDEKLFGG